jgi:GTP-binding protein HflX
MTVSSRCGIIIPYFVEKTPEKSERSLTSRLEEAVGLAEAIDLDVAFAVTQTLKARRSATVFGKGKVEEVAQLVQTDEVTLVIVDDSLSPIQQRNLEKAWKCKVIDRTALILEIFGARARTREGTLQVELASLNYQKGRLVRSWTHLERQRGGFGFLGGPGETQMEADRRMINERIIKIKQQLESVTKTRRLQRKSRRDVPYPIIALVGYTNAGKSTLFNRITGANVLAEDKLFATLDPTLRAVKLPSGITAIFSDTVGFVSNLPTELVAAFRATLEEVIEADVILHIRDTASPESDAQYTDVKTILAQLLDEKTLHERVLEVHNKIDLLPISAESVPPLGVSALTGEGIAALLQRADEKVQQLWGYEPHEIALPAADGKRIAWLHANARVLHQQMEDEMITLTVYLRREDWERFERLPHSKEQG